jgi:hypothetical protein
MPCRLIRGFNDAALDGIHRKRGVHEFIGTVRAVPNHDRRQLPSKLSAPGVVASGVEPPAGTGTVLITAQDLINSRAVGCAPWLCLFERGSGRQDL